MRSSLLKGILPVLLIGTLAPVAQAQRLLDNHVTAKMTGVAIQTNNYIYNNTGNFQGFGYRPQGATDASPITYLDADDVTFPSGYAGRKINTFIFFIYNKNTVPTGVRPRYIFWLPDGPNGGPGTPYDNNGTSPGGYGITYNPITVPASVVQGYGSNISGLSIPLQVPTGGKFWVGVVYDNVGTTTTTAAQLNLFGVGLFGAPLIGTSNDVFYESDNTGTFFGVTNPPGGLYDFGHSTTPANPIANLGFGFQIDTYTLSGTVTLEGNPPTAGIPATIELKQGSTVVFTRTVTLDAAGNFTLPLVPADTFDVYVKTPKTLKTKVAGVNLTTADVTNFAVTLRAGDANNDNAVDIQDLLVLIGAYNKLAANNDGYMDAADFNGDGANDITDLLLIIGHYNQLGD